MNKLNLLAMGVMLFAACGEPAKKAEEKVAEQPVKVGGDKDEHGCIASAGYTWSQIKNDCIRIFNEGFRLNPVTAEKDNAVVSAFVLMSEDQTKVELFLPGDTSGSVLLPKVGNLRYQNATYQYDANKSVLYVDGKAAYKGNVE